MDSVESQNRGNVWLWSLGSVFGVAIFIALRDLSTVGWAPALTLATTATFLLVFCVLAMTGLSRLWKRVSASLNLRWCSAFIGGGLPLLLAAVDWWGSRSALPWWSPFLGLGAGLFAGAVLYRITSQSTGIARLTLAVIGWYLLYRGCDVFVIIRPGTGLLHLGLFIGTWGASIGLVMCLPRPHKIDPMWRMVLALLIGIALLEIDRRVLVDLYIPIHIWLFTWGVYALAQGFSQGLMRTTASADAVEGGASWAVRIGTAMALLALSVGMVVGYQTLRDAAARAELARSPVGNTLLSQVSLGDAQEPEEATITPGKMKRKRVAKSRVPPVSYERRLNLILITVDALRPDVLTTGPWLSSRYMRWLGKQSLRYERAYAQGTRTAIGMGSLMTGRYSAHIDWKLLVYRKGRLFDPAYKTPEIQAILAGPHAYTTVPHWPKEGTLSERLQRAGYYTAAAPYAGKNRFFATGVGFDRGFDDFADLTERTWRTPTSDNVMDVAMAQMEVSLTQGKPWFQWIHLYDAHRWRGGRSHYDRLVLHVDRQIGRLVKWLSIQGLAENTAIALIADHGEAFGEHRHKRHGTSLYDEQALVPFILYVPGVKPQVVQMPVAAIDLTATFLALAGASTDKLDGRNLLIDAMADREPPLRPIYTELHRYISRKKKRTTDLKGIVKYPHKLILDRRRRTPKLFNLDEDPGELTNLVGTEKITYTRLRRQLRRFLRRAEKTYPLP